MAASVAGRLEMQREQVVKKGPDIDFARSSFLQGKLEHVIGPSGEVRATISS